jgi:dihydroorotate dehydrogenase (NAD+) catalytic subunit
MSARLATSVGSLALANPIMAASGTFGYGLDLLEFCPPERLGAVGAPRHGSLRPQPG